MSGPEPTEGTPTRKERRSKSRPAVRLQRLASLVVEIAKEINQHAGEAEPDYYRRLQRKALQVQRYERRKKRQTVKAARKRNR